MKFAIITFVEHKNARFNSKLPRSTQKCLVRHIMPGSTQQCPARPNIYQLTLPLWTTPPHPHPYQNYFSCFIQKLFIKSLFINEIKILNDTSAVETAQLKCSINPIFHPCWTAMIASFITIHHFHSQKQHVLLDKSTELLLGYLIDIYRTDKFFVYIHQYTWSTSAKLTSFLWVLGNCVTCRSCGDILIYDVVTSFKLQPYVNNISKAAASSMVFEQWKGSFMPFRKCHLQILRMVLPPLFTIETAVLVAPSLMFTHTLQWGFRCSKPNKIK